MKTKEELKQIKEEVETQNKNLEELPDDELTIVAGGNPDDPNGFQISERMRPFIRE